MKAAESVLLALGSGCATTGQLVARVSCAVQSALRTLRKRELVTSVSGVHQLTPKGEAWLKAGLGISPGPRPGRSAQRTPNTLRAKTWRLMRIKRKFTLDDLLFVVADGDERGAEANVRTYLHALAKAGFVVPVKSGWLLLAERDTGPESPAWNSKTRTVTDVNTGELWPIG